MFEQRAARLVSLPLAAIGIGSLYLASLTAAMAGWDVLSIAALLIVGMVSLLAAILAWQSQLGGRVALGWFALLLLGGLILQVILRTGHWS